MKKRIILIAGIVLSFASCGGGGGGGGGGSKSSASTGVRILHASIDGAPLDLISSAKPGEVAGSAYFAEETFFNSLNTGNQQLTLTVHGIPGSVKGSASLILESKQHYSILFYGDELQIGQRTSLISDEPGEIPEGTAAVKVIHGMVGASRVNAVFSSQSEDGVEFGQASEYHFLTAGPNTISAKRASDGLTVASVTSTLESGKAYTLFLGGEIDYFKFGKLLED